MPVGQLPAHPIWLQRQDSARSVLCACSVSLIVFDRQHELSPAEDREHGHLRLLEEHVLSELVLGLARSYVPIASTETTHDLEKLSQHFVGQASSLQMLSMFAQATADNLNALLHEHKTLKLSVEAERKGAAVALASQKHQVQELIRRCAVSARIPAMHCTVLQCARVVEAASESGAQAGRRHGGGRSGSRSRARQTAAHACSARHNFGGGRLERRLLHFPQTLTCSFARDFVSRISFEPACLLCCSRPRCPNRSCKDFHASTSFRSPARFVPMHRCGRKASCSVKAFPTRISKSR